MSYFLRDSIVVFFGHMFYKVFWCRLEVCFFRLKSSNGFCEKLMFPKRPSFFVHFVGNVAMIAPIFLVQRR